MDDQLKQEMHLFRVEIDALINKAKEKKAILGNQGAREMSLVHTKLQEAKMWVGKVLEEMGHELPNEFQDKSKS